MAISAAQKTNCLWPLRRGAKGWVQAALIARYEAAIHNLIRTPLGSLPWNPGYGTSVHRLRTQSGPYGEVEGGLQIELRTAFAKWIPDIVLLGVATRMNPKLQRLEVLVTWGIPGVGSTPRTQLAVGPVKTLVPM